MKHLFSRCCPCTPFSYVFQVVADFVSAALASFEDNKMSCAKDAMDDSKYNGRVHIFEGESRNPTEEEAIRLQAERRRRISHCDHTFFVL